MKDGKINILNYKETMKKIVTTVMALVLMVTAGVVVTSCGAGTLLQTVASGGTLANAFSSVIGLDKVTKAGMVGTWHYDSPGCAFTSENLLAKAGGEVAATKIEQEMAPYFQKAGLTAQNTYTTFNEDGTIQISGLTKFGDPDQLISLNFSGRWKPVYDYKDNYNVVNSNVRPYAVELRLNDFCIDGEETKIDDPTIYKDTLLVEYKNGEIKLCMASDIQRYLGDDAKATTRGTVSDLWSLVKAAVAAGAITEEELIETCIEYISNLSEDEIENILSNLTDEDIEEVLAILEELTGEYYSAIINDDDD